MKQKTVKFLIILAVIALLVFFNSRGFLEAPKSLVYRVFAPFQTAATSFSRASAGIFDIFFRLKSVRDQNQKLIEENQKLLSEVTGLAQLEEENVFLRSELGLNKETQYNLTLADVIGSDTQYYDQLLFIDKGSADGIKAGDIVILGGRLLLGKISAVYGRTSEVETIYNYDVRINAITDNSKAAGVFMSTNSGLILDLIDPRKKIEIGERVLTSGMLGAYPKGLYIGNVTELINRDNQIFKQARVEAPYDPKDVERVFVITDEP